MSIEYYKAKLPGIHYNIGKRVYCTGPVIRTSRGTKPDFQFYSRLTAGRAHRQCRGETPRQDELYQHRLAMDEPPPKLQLRHGRSKGQKVTSFFCQLYSCCHFF